MPYIVNASSLNHPFLEGPYEYGNVHLNSGDVVFDLGRYVDNYLDYKDSGGIKLKYWNDGNKNVNDFRRRIADKIQTSKEEDFKMMLQLDECPVDANYLFKSVIITDDEQS